MASWISDLVGLSALLWRRIYDLRGAAENCDVRIYDPSRSGIQIHGIRSRDPFSGSTSMSGWNVGFNRGKHYCLLVRIVPFPVRIQPELVCGCLTSLNLQFFWSLQFLWLNGVLHSLISTPSRRNAQQPGRRLGSVHVIPGSGCCFWDEVHWSSWLIVFRNGASHRRLLHWPRFGAIASSIHGTSVSPVSVIKQWRLVESQCRKESAALKWMRGENNGDGSLFAAWSCHQRLRPFPVTAKK